MLYFIHSFFPINWQNIYLRSNIHVQIEHKIVTGSSRYLDIPNVMYITHQQEMLNQQLIEDWHILDCSKINRLWPACLLPKTKGPSVYQEQMKHWFCLSVLSRQTTAFWLPEGCLQRVLQWVCIEVTQSHRIISVGRDFRCNPDLKTGPISRLEEVSLGHSPVKCWVTPKKGFPSCSGQQMWNRNEGTMQDCTDRKNLVSKRLIWWLVATTASEKSRDKKSL